MARSYRHTPIFGWTTARSDKKFKQESSRRHRHVCKLLLHANPFREIYPEFYELTNPYTSPKDGKVYWPEATKRNMCK